MSDVHIRSPFVSAGRVFHWTPQYGMVGVGIAERYCLGDGVVRITVGNKPTVYRMSKHLAKKLVTRYSSYYTAGSVLLWILPLDAFEVVPSMETAQKTLSEVF